MYFILFSLIPEEEGERQGPIGVADEVDTRSTQSVSQLENGIISRSP
jgi:hypothetical protein